ncbi:hypothetical protein BOTBODRAFT_143676 [Botryobasidium botryosum FD-172 SS1]|uniref:Thioester reductase (TE) domain-containing protein n=1 Tax=Botryobasidium botryosum (strain FD-172 SS1) TaxID=930990 RepID=A0A067MTB5_BOTB1|nr:hypothetical protein BOTBODRAFT_143676 [Botryobasidium botryosum FD-172 SS1]
MRKTDELNALVAKYTADFPTHRPLARDGFPSTAAGSTDVVLVTGTTGGLGTALLRDLVALPSVSRIYAFNRKDKRGVSLRERQAEALAERGLDPKILDSPKVVLVEGDTSVSDLGLSDALFAEIRDSVTCIMHNAWRVNFMQEVSAYETLIRGVRNLVDFALASPHSSPPRFVYTSSTAAVMNWPLATPVPEQSFPDARVALGMGYGESKWVSERILRLAAESTALRPVVVRVGQLTYADNGEWSGTEWIPTILRSALAMGILPSVDLPIPVLTLSSASKGLIEMMSSPYPTVHLVHPRPVKASHICQLIADIIGLEPIPFTEWIDKLEESVNAAQDEGEEMERNPAVVLLPLFQMFLPRLSKKGRDAIGMPLYETKLALQVAPSLAEGRLPQTGMDDVQRVLKHWQETGLFQGILDGRDERTLPRFVASPKL